MSDKPEVSSAATPQPAEKPDASLNARRLLVWAIATATGIALTAIVLILVRIPLDATLFISFVELPFLPLAALPMVLLCLIWVDYFFGTRILPD
ncbi:MAG: hypothetical protein CUN49_12745 [Candidatus Thermofonsia Clade 1 bacterium]|jgi:hypothetical protein|uniref:Uncharacterized protein n=1 Tax=Candidatus Thermofonsia Clade 1 bacterium TaxID=2364210 RepID=A0A2M8PBU4_9CHLR|nr:MAG: hypothetical protein CUN49_12745 [Candidatus Thermofonsia Clade 1 bacterium]RMF52401.1 MAG: hypothetical protein D6749_05060 [Chloroflexota bacterium]